MSHSSTAGGLTRRTPNPWYVAVVSGMASYIDAAAIVSSGIALVLYQHSSVGITGDQIGILSAALTLGIAGGALVGGRLGDRYGRRRVFMITMALVVIGSAMEVFAGSFAPLLIGSALAGFATGADLPVSISTIAEVGTDKNRGKLVGFSQVLWSIGIITTLGLSALVGDLGRLGGQIMFAHVGVVALIVLVLRLTIPESAVWLSAREERLTGVRTERAVRSNLRFLFTKPYLVPFVSLLVFYALVNLAANTGGQFGTYLWVNAAGSTVQVSSLVSLAVWPLALILSGVFMRIVDTKHRMRFFYVGLVAYVLSPLVPAVFGVSVPTLILNSVFGAIGGALAFEAIMKVWTQESFPTLLRTTAQGTIIAVARVMAAGLALVTPNLIAHGPTTLFVFLTVVMIIGMAAAVLAFRHGTRNEFTIETRLVGDDRPAEPVVSAA